MKQGGEPLPQGKDYQHGERYGHESLRKAVFSRDGYKCVFCERGLNDRAIFHTHHIGYWFGDRSDRMSNLATVCEKCHTPAEHQPGGKLYGKKPKLRSFAGAAFMTTIRWQMLNEIKTLFPDVQVTYGAATHLSRQARCLPKSHINDVYCIGEFRPHHRTTSLHIKKVRRNDRVLQTFYDAKYIDSRDGSKKTGKELFNGRINRSRKKDSENLHKYRQRKISKGHVAIRKSRVQIKPGSIVLYNGERLIVHGTHAQYWKNKKSVIPIKSINVEFTTTASNGRKSADLSKCTVLGTKLNHGWELINNE